MLTLTQVRFILKPLVFAACLIPLLHAVGDLYGVTGTLGPNPVENLQDRFGIWGLRLLVATLAITPLNTSLRFISANLKTTFNRLKRSSTTIKRPSSRMSLQRLKTLISAHLRTQAAA